jgi:ABC-type uncharacterized transport system YnjBCD permease subunit
MKTHTKCYPALPAEIETVMASVNGVVDVAAVLQDATKPTAAIVGYVSPADADTDAVLAACRARLAHYMVPSAVVALHVMPRLANGKVTTVRCSDVDICSATYVALDPFHEVASLLMHCHGVGGPQQCPTTRLCVHCGVCCTF